MSSTIPRFFSQPFRYIRWAAIEKPAIFFSLVVGSIGPVLVLTVPKIRHRLGDGPRPQIPLTYPIPSGPRKPLSGYDDDGAPAITMALLLGLASYNCLSSKAHRLVLYHINHRGDLTTSLSFGNFSKFYTKSIINYFVGIVSVTNWLVVIVT
ncbi:hypothetical protein EYC80_008799 [Monilinia laxa]|uniref:NADH-ubiquinone oxidoreductase 9.5 kDa subunit n=1 Tax=Monilinia laxa TaxID=61186 RepID=A0A5N6K1I4_MONLA|nr:hypothetical protein EYC80_008799 [Monilinia laxa]